jgi:hypothetical protein
VPQLKFADRRTNKHDLSIICHMKRYLIRRVLDWTIGFIAPYIIKLRTTGNAALPRSTNFPLERYTRTRVLRLH